MDDEAAAAVCAATAAGDRDLLLKLLVNGGANSTDAYGITALTIGCCMGHRECVALLLLRNADPNLLCSKLGPAPLHMASQERRADIVEMLVLARANQSLVILGRTALQVALERGCAACVQLLEGSAPLREPAPTIMVPSTAASEASPQRVPVTSPRAATRMCDAAGDGESETVRQLLADGCDANAINEDGEPCLFLACAFGQAESAQLLMTAHANVAACSASSGATALGVASLGGHLEIIDALLRAGAAVDARGELGTAALHGCAAHGQVVCAARLLDAHASPSATDARGATPLHYAACEGQAACVSLLLARGADALATAEGGLYAAGMARERGYTSCAALLDKAAKAAMEARAEVAAASLLATAEADTRLESAMDTADVAALRAALEECGSCASPEVLANARAARHRLRRRQRKKGRAGAVASESASSEGRPRAESRLGVADDELLAVLTPAGSADLAVATAAELSGASGAATASAPSAAGSASWVPQQYLCPITLVMMRDPVITADGHTYERAAIEEWLEAHSTSPCTGAPLAHRVLAPSIALRQLILEFESKVAGR